MATKSDRFTIQPKPVIAPKGILNIGDYTDAVAPGALVSIFGQNLAMQSTVNTFSVLPSELNGVRVRIGDVPAPMVFVSPNQVNVQVPFDIHGTTTVELTNANGVAQQNINIAPSAPSILVITSNNVAVSSTNVPAAGSTLVVYANGLGACRQTLSFGAAANGPVRR